MRCGLYFNKPINMALFCLGKKKAERGKKSYTCRFWLILKLAPILKFSIIW